MADPSSASAAAASKPSSSPHQHLRSSSSADSLRAASRSVARRFSQHTLKQLKFVLPGGLVTYLLGTLARFGSLVEGKTSGWARVSAWASLACGILTIGLFLYILLLPWIKGIQPNYSQWRRSGELSLVVPTLTTLIVIGWPLLSFTLSYFTDLGTIKGVAASSGLYALGFGLLGLVPAPMVKRP